MTLVVHVAVVMHVVVVPPLAPCRMLRSVAPPLGRMVEVVCRLLVVVVLHVGACAGVLCCLCLCFVLFILKVCQ